jgi:type I restriction enzyme, S subunit
MSFKLTIGRVSTLGIDACHNEAIISIYPKPCVDQRYLGYFLSQVDYDDHQDRQIKGNTLNQDKINKIPIPIPPKHEQLSIADVLDAVRKAISLEVEAVEVAGALKRAAMATLFTRGLKGEAQKETEIGLVPQSWDVISLGSLGRIGSGTTPDRTNPNYWRDGSIPWVTSGRMYEREINGSDVCVTALAIENSSLPMLKPGAVLIAIVGQGKTLGHCAILGVEATVSRHVGYVQPNQAIISPAYLRGYLEGQYDYLRQLAAGNGSTRAALTGGILKAVPVPLPPTLDEQQEIVAVLDAIDVKIDLHTRKRAVLDELFKSLLHKLMTGEFRVGDLDLSALKSSEVAAVAA